ncbi:COG4705 family protein [Gallaecimonas mangrovi]|uniref:COG4705 family protein n=1 Tax=Gallaecimonas mangrovi TaxID=2291597 RepID=UPI000E1FE2DA|nr:hypothetical protein [Gallaecimonas mangrovi]
MHNSHNDAFAKVPAITLGFWLIKILVTTLGETGGDSVSMSLGLGYLASSGLFVAVFALLLWQHIASTGFRPFLYWATLIASTTLGTTLSDFATRSLGLGYAGGSLLLAVLVVMALVTWQRCLGRINVASVKGPAAEGFYWLSITFSQTLGTALGDWTADGAGIGYEGGIAIFGGALLLVVALRFASRFSPPLLFWLAFVLTRPLGAVVGDFLDKPVDDGGLALSRFAATGSLLIAVLLLITFLPQRPAKTPH